MQQFFLLFLALIHLSVADFACGSQAFSWSINLAEEYVLDYCPAGYNRFDTCCQIHDSCYSQRLGREKCDDEFCYCMKKASDKSGCKNNQVGDHFCEMVRALGGIIYGSKQ